MSPWKIKSFLLFQHSLADYIRVAAIAVIVLLAILILRLFGSREDNENKFFKRYSKITETVRLDS